MMCKKPFTKGVESHGCGQCMPCRLNRRRIWTHRMMLEAAVHPAASFVTLTYKENPITLIPRDLQLFIKRVRKNVGSCRFFAVGEYGDHSDRPHYHVALFGHGPQVASLIDSCWGLGYTYTGDLTLDSAQYIAGYVTKKMTSKDDTRLNGRYPEFARMSLRPGIGAPAIRSVAAALQNKHGWDEIDARSDVPSMLRHGGRTMPLGRYMRLRLRDEMNFSDLSESEDAAFKRHQKMLDVYRDYLDPSEVTPFNLYKGKDAYEKNEKLKVEKLESRIRATKRVKTI